MKSLDSNAAVIARRLVIPAVNRMCLRSLLTTMAAACSLCCSAAGPIHASLKVVDDLGRTIVLSGRPERIVSLEPSVTEELFAVGAGDRIAADDNFADFPPAAKQKEHVNGMGPSRETMIALHSDLIILFDQTFTAQKADVWQRLYRVPVYVLNAATYTGVETDIRRLGDLAGTSAKTLGVLTSMERTKRNVQSAVAHRLRPKVFVVVWDHPLMTAGKNTFIGNLIELAGGVNVAAPRVSGYPTYSPEQLAADDPDYIIGGTTGAVVIRSADPSLASLGLAAERDGNEYAIPDDWTSRPGPRLALGVEAVARVLHPECFTNKP